MIEDDDMSEGTADPAEDRGFEFGVFDFDELADWLADRHARCAAWLVQTARARANASGEETLAEAYGGVGLSVAIDTAYLGMLALAVQYSVQQDLLDGGFAPSDLFEKEPFRRARTMLCLHADRLPADATNEQLLDNRAAMVATLLMPVAVSGFDNPNPLVAEVVQQLPPAVTAAWQAHPHADNPLCQMMTVSFWLAFRHMVHEAGGEAAWSAVLEDFWEGWCNHLLDVQYALAEEDLDAE